MVIVIGAVITSKVVSSANTSVNETDDTTTLLVMEGTVVAEEISTIIDIAGELELGNGGKGEGLAFKSNGKQVTTPLAWVHPAEALINDTSGGNVSVITIPIASEGPVFVTTIS